jgi:hypothetical protein
MLLNLNVFKIKLNPIAANAFHEFEIAPQNQLVQPFRAAENF